VKRLWVVALFCIAGFLPVGSFAEDSIYEPVSAMKHPSDNKWSKDKEELGKMLYFDPRLSGSNWISCATCPNPGLGWSDGLPRTIGDGQKELGRHAPTIINSGYFELQIWDGRKKSLEDQASGPIGADVEMNQDYDELIRELKVLPGYVSRFDTVFGKNSLTIENIAKAIATFERSVVSKNVPYDKYWTGDKSAMSTSAVNGMNLFWQSQMLHLP
jgi:cytochrome c peroxidase